MHAQKDYQAKARRAWMIIAACITALAILGAAPLMAAQASNPPRGLATTSGADVTVSETITSPVSVGETIQLVMTVKNIGDQQATGVTLSNDARVAQSWRLDPAVPGCSYDAYNSYLSCAWDTLDSNAEIEVRLVATATDGCSNPTHTFYNNAKVSATNDVNTGNNTSATASLEIDCTSIGINVVDDPLFGEANAGDPIGFIIQVSNSGPGSALGITVSDALPTHPGLHWSLGDVTVPTGTTNDCDVSTGSPQELTCHFDRQAPGGENMISIKVVSPTTLDSCGLVENGAAVSATNDGSAVAGNSITVNCPPPATTAQIAPLGTTCSDFKAQTAASLPNGETYTVQNSRIRTTSPAAFIYYSEVIAPADTFSVKVAQSNTGGWPKLGNYFSMINPQINIYNDSCNRVATTGTFLPSSITFKVTGATPGGVYYVGIRYQADSVVGRLVTSPYPSVPYTFTTLVDNTLLDPNTVSLTFHP